MSDTRTILVVVDPTADDQPALERAAWLATALHAALELFVCDYDQALAGYPLFDSAGLERVRAGVIESHIAKLETLSRPLIAQGLRVTVDARWGRPIHEGIVAKVGDTRPILVVKDTHYHAVLKRTILSNTDWSLIRECPAPLLLVKPGAIGTPPKVLAAVDPMHEHDKPAELDRTILAFAESLATAVGGQLHVLHAFDPVPMLAAASATPVPFPAVPVAELTAALEGDHRKALDELLAGRAIDPPNVHLAQGAPDQCLEEAAAGLGIDFVVMGAVSRSGLRRIFVGSTAERVLDRLPCDLIVVKGAGFEAPAD